MHTSFKYRSGEEGGNILPTWAYVFHYEDHTWVSENARRTLEEIVPYIIHYLDVWAFIEDFGFWFPPVGYPVSGEVIPLPVSYKGERHGRYIFTATFAGEVKEFHICVEGNNRESDAIRAAAAIANY